MTTAVVTLVAPEEKPAAPLSTEDKVTIGLIIFYAVVAFTLELYWIVFNQVMESQTDVFAKTFAVYWPADYTYRVSGYPIAKCFSLAVESVNTAVFQPLSLLLVYGIVKRRHYRYPLQLILATCIFYGTVLYWYVAHLSGYAVFAYKGVYTYALFYLANAPWFFGCGWMMLDATRHILERFKTTE